MRDLLDLSQGGFFDGIQGGLLGAEQLADQRKTDQRAAQQHGEKNQAAVFEARPACELQALQNPVTADVQRGSHEREVDYLHQLTSPECDGACARSTQLELGVFAYPVNIGQRDVAAVDADQTMVSEPVQDARKRLRLDRQA